MPLQFWITLVLGLGMLETTVLFAQYLSWNDYGAPALAVTFIALFFGVLKVRGRESACVDVRCSALYFISDSIPYALFIKDRSSAAVNCLQQLFSPCIPHLHDNIFPIAFSCFLLFLFYAIFSSHLYLHVTPLLYFRISSHLFPISLSL
jgi:hypothetical protein